MNQAQIVTLWMMYLHLKLNDGQWYLKMKKNKSLFIILICNLIVQPNFNYQIWLDTKRYSNSIEHSDSAEEKFDSNLNPTLKIMI